MHWSLCDRLSLGEINVFLTRQPADVFGSSCRSVLIFRRDTGLPGVRRGCEKRVQGLQPERLGFKYPSKVARDHLSHLIQSRRLFLIRNRVPFHLMRQGGYRLIGNATWDDELEVIEISIHVQGETVGRYSS